MGRIKDSGVIVKCKLPPGKKALPCKWVYALKTDSNNVIVRYKARLVVRGDFQIDGIDYEEIFSPIVRWESIRLFLALTVLLKLIPLQLDVDTAFLLADLDEEIYMNPPPGDNLEDGFVYRLKKSLYGLKQAGRNWNQLLNNILQDYKFVRLDSDHCLYILYEGGKVTLLFIYVDDIYIAASDKESLNLLVEYLQGHFKLKLLGVPQQLLGLVLTWG